MTNQPFDSIASAKSLADFRARQANAPSLVEVLERIAAGDVTNPQFAALAVSEARAALEPYNQ